jgi:hypothetical protein
MTIKPDYSPVNPPPDPAGNPHGPPPPPPVPATEIGEGTFDPAPGTAEHQREVIENWVHEGTTAEPLSSIKKQGDL